MSLVQSSKATQEPLHRPSAARLLWYCYGGSVPAESRTWVLHDVTCRTWALRHFVRWTMIVIPVFALLMTLLPTPFATRLFTSIAVSGGIWMFALVNIMIDTDRRAVRAGYSFNLPSEMREAGAGDRQRSDNHQRRERIAERQQRRRR